jgi:hypothetical protein
VSEQGSSHQAPEWLPALLEIDWNAYDDTVDSAHEIFARDFVDVANRATFNGKRLGLKYQPEFEGRSATFWHFVTEGRQEATRIPVRERLERIRWPRVIIDNAHDPTRVRVWAVKNGSETRWHLAPLDFSYLVVLVDRGTYILPWTAFPIDSEHQRKKKAKEYEAYVLACGGGGSTP